MGSTLSVTTLQGLTSGVNANQVVVPTGHKIIGTDSGSVYAPGSVVQCVQYYNLANSATTTTSASYVASGIKKSITPIYSNSLIIIQAHMSMVYSTVSGRATLYLNGSIMPGANNYAVGYTSVSDNNYSPYICNAQYQATSTSPLEFEVYVLAESGSYTYIHVNSSTSMTLWEIAQ